MNPPHLGAVADGERRARLHRVATWSRSFAASPVLRGTLSADAEESERNTLLRRRFAGGSLKIVAARAPRNLRRHTARILIVDEADACETGAGRQPNYAGGAAHLVVRQPENNYRHRRRFSRTPRTSCGAMARAIARVYEVPCPECGGFTEIMWQNIEWEPDRPETAAFRCPHCKALIEERQKVGMVTAGRWRVTRPDVKGHAGFRLNALVSLLANASWAKLAAEFLAAK